MTRATNALGIALAYILGLLTPFLIYVIFYALARVEPRVASSYRAVLCNSLATGV